MTDRADLAELASLVVDAIAGAAPAADVEVTTEHAEQALTRFANSAIHQNIADESTEVQVRVHLDGRTVTLSSGVGTLSDAGTVAGAALASFTERVLDAVRSGPRDPGWPGLAPPAPVLTSPPPPAVGPPGERAALVRAFVDAAGGLETAGYCSVNRNSRAFANSAGQVADTVFGSAAFDGIARREGSDGLARLSTDSLVDVDGHALGLRAAAKATASGGAVEIPADRWPVVLEPAAVADLLATLVLYGFNGKAVTQRQSFAEVGTAQFDTAITITDDAAAHGITFDADGTPTQPLTLVDRGVTAAITHDRRTAAEADTVSTGHGVGASWGGIALNTSILPGTDASVDAADLPAFVDPAAAPLLAGVDRGLLVSDLWYTRVLDPKSLGVTGLTRNGVWLIERGEVTRPVQNMRFTQAYAAALAAGQVRGVGPTATELAEDWIPARWTVPALHLASWNFTGGASG